MIKLLILKILNCLVAKISLKALNLKLSRILADKLNLIKNYYAI